jgi:hypothetical protein
LNQSQCEKRRGNQTIEEKRDDVEKEGYSGRLVVEREIFEVQDKVSVGKIDASVVDALRRKGEDKFCHLMPQGAQSDMRSLQGDCDDEGERASVHSTSKWSRMKVGDDATRERWRRGSRPNFANAITGSLQLN